MSSSVDRVEEVGSADAAPGWSVVAPPSPSVLASLRARQWAHFTLLPLAGLDTSLDAGVGAMTFLRGVAIAVAVLAYGYLLNGLADRSVDRDRAKNPLAGFRGPTSVYRLAVMALAAVAVLLAATGPWIVLGATAVALVSGTLYSVGPRLKRVPGVGTLLNVGCFAPLLFVGMAQGSVAEPRWALAAAFAGLLLQNQLVHEAADAPEDRAGDVRSSFVVLGPARTAVLALVAGVGVGLASWWLLEARSAPLLVCLHVVPYVTVFPWLLAQHGERAGFMARLRKAHRGFSVVSGAVLLLVTVWV